MPNKPNIGNIFSNSESRREILNPREQQSFIEKAVVSHVFTDQTTSSEYSKQLSSVSQTLDPTRIPRNSLIVRRVSKGLDSIGSSAALAYPMFSSHLSMPVKVGEMVWIIFDRDLKNIGYWLSRVHGDELCEDANYSHYDRIYKPTVVPSSSPGTANKALGIPKPGEYPPEDDFPNFSLSQNSDYESMFRTSSSRINLEPVPRYSKKPGDFVIQGSNNTLISLTTDRGWDSSTVPSTRSSAYSVSPSFSGTIDIVAGRSRWISKGNSGRTIPPSRVNTRGFSEVNKDTRILAVSGSVANPNEGDPDFLEDASRIYVSMSTEIDRKFMVFEGQDQKPTVPGEFQARLVSGSAGIAIKSDQLRLIARQDDVNGINGSIHILKEGEKSSEGDHACISLLDDGSVLVTGRRLYFGRSFPDGGLGDGPADSPSGAQPYIKYQQLENLLTKIINDVQNFCDTLSTHTTPGYGAPSVQINQAAAALKSAIEARKSEIQSIKSTRIFGE